MSISITALPNFNVSNQAACTELCDYLQSEATDYFSSVSVISDGGNYRVACVYQGVEVISMYCNVSSRDIRTLQLCNGVGFANYWPFQTYPKVYKSSKGIFFPTGNFGGRWVFKNNRGETVVASDWWNTSTNGGMAFGDCKNSSAFYRPYTGSSIANIVSASTKTAQINSLCPVVFGDCETYVSGVYWLAFKEEGISANPAVIEINGKQYVTNGIIAMEE